MKSAVILFAALLSAPALAAPACPTGETSAAYLCTAVGDSDAGRFAEAATGFEKAAGLAAVAAPETQRMWAAAGNMWIAAGEAGKAALDLDRALTGTGLQAEQRGLALLDRARAAEAQSDLKGARRFFNEAAPTIGNDPFAWYFSAALAVREGDLATAKTSIGRALTLAPTMPEALFEAGHIAEAQGDTAGARDYWTRATAAAEPGSKIAASAKAALNALGAPVAFTPPPARKP